MKSKTTRVLSIAALSAATALCMTGCSRITEVSLSVPETIERGMEDTAYASYTFSGDTLEGEKLEEKLSKLGMHYESSNPDVVFVTDDGTLEAMSAGTAKITYASENGKLSSAVLVKVQVTPESITIPESFDITIGDEQKITPEIVPEDSTFRDVRYTTSNKAVATVDETGTVTAVSEGTTVITAQIEDTEVSAECIVTVYPALENLKLSSDSMNVVIGNSKTLSVTPIPENALAKDIEFVSDNPDIASVDENGNITANAKGNATITVKCDDIVSTCTVNAIKYNVPQTGVAGRIVIPDLGISTHLVYQCSQAVVDASDSAAIWASGGGYTVADHWNQGNYTNIQYSVPGSTIAYIDNVKYICTSKFHGHNNGVTITDEAGNDVMNTLGAGQALLYTCNGCWQNVHIAIYQIC